ncbi:MAG TPA: class I SAM-dependent methyltransferase [Candidatus Gallacutalibacter stercoravium]|nr:class I SAM-dependent methyltransferase [Candidatus Gallacutalibacter stercoravium]
MCNQGNQKNADRFTGFADVYDSARPAMPEYPARVICRYLGKRPDLVVDLGCGTGLSTRIWKEYCQKAVGVEPSADMLAIACEKQTEQISFVQGFGDNTGLPDGCADAVVCSQSFHWMNPETTLKEVDRILARRGVFATVDCDWPPVADWRAEEAYMKLYGKVKKLESALDDVRDTFVRYSKEKHLQNIKNSGYFAYCREIVFSNTESCTAERFIRLLLSQGSLQIVRKKHPEMIEDDIAAFSSYIRNLYGNEPFSMDFCYRMRLGVRGESE